MQPRAQLLRLESEDSLAGLDVDVCMALVETLKHDELSIPPLPRSASELLRLTNDPDAHVDKVVATVERDVTIAARVLRMAQAAAFGPFRVTDLRSSVRKIGIKGVRNVVLASNLASAFPVGPFAKFMRAEIEHGYAVACGATVLARKQSIDPQLGFLCGLMHDVGCPALLSVLAQKAKEDPRVGTPVMAMAVLDDLHPDAGAMVARAWGLPPEVLGPIRTHHMAGEAQLDKLTLVVAVADAIDQEKHPDEAERLRLLMQHPACVALKISEDLVKEIAQVIEDARADGVLNSLVG